MFYRYEHYMSISHIALIVNMVQDNFQKGGPGKETKLHLILLF